MFIYSKDENTIPTDLFNALEAQRSLDNPEDQSVNVFLPPWTTQPGYPVITVIRESKTFTVSQVSKQINSWIHNDNNSGMKAD